MRPLTATRLLTRHPAPSGRHHRSPPQPFRAQYVSLQTALTWLSSLTMAARSTAGRRAPRSPARAGRPLPPSRQARRILSRAQQTTATLPARFPTESTECPAASSQATVQRIAQMARSSVPMVSPRTHDDLGGAWFNIASWLPTDSLIATLRTSFCVWLGFLVLVPGGDSEDFDLRRAPVHAAALVAGVGERHSFNPNGDVHVRHDGRTLAVKHPRAYRERPLPWPEPIGRDEAQTTSIQVYTGAGSPGLVDNGFYPADAQLAREVQWTLSREILEASDLAARCAAQTALAGVITRRWRGWSPRDAGGGAARRVKAPNAGPLPRGRASQVSCGSSPD